MPLDRLVLILVCAVGVTAAAIWLVSVIVISASVSPALAFVPILVAGIVFYILVRVVGERVNSDDDDHYDQMKH